MTQYLPPRGLDRFGRPCRCRCHDVEGIKHVMPCCYGGTTNPFKPWPETPVSEPVVDHRPVNCRFRLQDEGKPYPRSGCASCGATVTTGLGRVCPYVRSGVVTSSPIEVGRRDWPADARYQYGDMVSVIRKRDDSPRWEGFVVGWYEPTPAGKKHFGYNVEQRGTGQVHVYSEAALQDGWYPGYHG